MEISIKLISMDTIKPSSPTPKPLQKHHLSSLDQSAAPILLPLIYMFQSNPNFPNPQKSNILKKSLSEVLSAFYPLAGTIVGNHYVDCNDAGASFSEAEADCHLSQLPPHPNHQLTNRFLPYNNITRHHPCLAVQVTYFRCGAAAVGILVSHKLADALSVVTFFNAWAAVAANRDVPPPPKFDAAAYFPPLPDTSSLDPARALTGEDIATEVISFPAAKIAALRERYSSTGCRRPSRVEALSAFIWTQFVSAKGARSDPSNIFLVCHMINVRSRVEPPLPENYFGNVVGVSMAMVAAEDGGAEVVKKIREAVKAVKSGYVSRRSETGNLYNDKIVPLVFSSVCGFPLYEADFGWGRPVWARFGRSPAKNTVYFWDSARGGIDASIHLTKQDMCKFEAHQMLKSNM